MTTTYENKTAILADLWTNYRDEEAFAELFEYADLSFPIAFAVFHGIVDTTERAQSLIDEAFGLLLEVVGVDDDGFDSLDDLLDAAGMED